MTLEDFKASLASSSPPAEIAVPLQALWQDAKGDWTEAHRLAQSTDDADGAWVHAYLHRKEGDLSNAAYWYNCAGRRQSKASLDEEWGQIVSELLVADD